MPAQVNSNPVKHWASQQKQGLWLEGVCASLLICPTFSLDAFCESGSAQSCHIEELGKKLIKVPVS